MRPNILVIMTDQQSATMMSCAGNKYLNTPAMDYISKSGTRFERAYCTNPVCMPSRFSLFTGKMPSFVNLKENITHDVLNEKIEILKKQGIGTIMRNAGYDVCYSGKQHLPKFNASDLGFNMLTLDERDELAEKCVDYINQKREKPFFLVASLINPHDICYMAIRDFAQTEEENNIIKKGITELKNVDVFLSKAKDGGEDFIEKNCPPLPENFMPQEDEPNAIKDFLKLRPFQIAARENYTKNHWRMHRYVYHRLTEMVDKQIGKIIQALIESGQEENTVIIFTSDHGDMDSAHKMEHKTVLYDEACRIPLIISQKGTTPAGLVDTTNLISNGLDLIPTICDYAEVEQPEGLEGISLRQIAEGKPDEKWRDTVKIESQIGRMIITKDFKYAKYDSGDNNEQLYDLINDTFETSNSAFLEKNKEVLNYHRKQFDLLFE